MTNLAGTVLLVDDDALVLQGYAGLLARHTELRVLTADSGLVGLAAARIHRPDLILSDLRMPEMDGFEFCRRIREEPSLEATMFVIVTGVPDAHAGLNPADGIDDLMVKPVMAVELEAKIRAMLRLKRLHDQLRADKLELKRLHQVVEDRSERLLGLLAQIVDLSVPGAAVRGAETARLALRMAERFEIPEALVKDLEVAARLHEIGKVLLDSGRTDTEGPEDVIEGDQWRYAVASKELLEQTEGLEGAAELIGAIFEDWAGTGHPERLRQGQIPLRSRILRILTDYERMMTRGHLSSADALQQLHDHAGTRYDPLAVAYFDAILRAASQADWQEARMRVPVANLAEGMRLADDLVTSSGVKLLAQGAILGPATLDTIRRRHQSDPILHGAWVDRGPDGRPGVEWP